MSGNPLGKSLKVAMFCLGADEVVVYWLFGLNEEYLL